jgi:hypothetical protein
MNITRRTWVVFSLCAALSLGIWFRLEYPHFNFIDLRVEKKEAKQIADSFLTSQGVNIQGCLSAIVFDVHKNTDTYLQKTLGRLKEEEFLQSNNFELFCWRVRYFKELQKEEYLLELSPKTGEVLSFRHRIEDTEPRESLDKEEAKKKAEEFLRNNYGIDFKEYIIHEENSRRYEKRIDYNFSWEKKGVYIPWKQEEGVAKLLTGATVSGNQIRDFYKNSLSLPEKFNRYIENQATSGGYVASLSFLAYLILLFFAAVTTFKKKHSVVVSISKKWFIGLTVIFAVLNFLSILNDLQSILISYSTIIQLFPFFGIIFLRFSISIVATSLPLVFFGLGGEFFCAESGVNKHPSFYHYFKSTFFSRKISSSVLFGYLLFAIILAMQAVIFYFGETYLGVWKEWVNFTQLSSAYFPVLGAFIIGFCASFNEEVIYRLFGISWGRRYFKNTFIAIVISALIWGFGHTIYAVFPFWFRGIEITILGIFFGVWFIKYGIIPLLVAHYLFDVFWSSAAYLFGRSQPVVFFGSLFVLLLPLAFAIIAYALNRQDREKEVKALLDPIQSYNVKVLIPYISSRIASGIDMQVIKEELIAHNWDIVLIELAISEILKAREI